MDRFCVTVVMVTVEKMAKTAKVMKIEVKKSCISDNFNDMKYS